MKAAVSYLSKQSPLALAGGAALLLVVVYVVGKGALKGAAGLVSGNNAITQNQTNAAGEKTTAYEGAGIVGTVGAVVNSASGGAGASFGESLGGWFYDLTHDDPLAPPKIDVGGTGGQW